MTGAEVFLTAPEGAPSLTSALIRVGLAVAVLTLVAGAWIYWHRKIKGPTRQLEILDRAFLARGSSVTLLRVDERRLLVGVSAEGVRLLARLDEEPTDTAASRRATVAHVATASPDEGDPGGFAAVLHRESRRREVREC